MGIITFEEQTHELTEKELELLPYVVNILSETKGKHKTIKNEILSIMACGQHRIEKGLDKPLKLYPARLRKIIHYIRVSNLIPVLCASSNGYYIGVTEDEIENFIQSLQERENSTKEIRTSLQNQYVQFKINKLPKQTEIKFSYE